jgi:hypothetical protein
MGSMSSSSSPSGQQPTLQELRAMRGAQPSFARRFRGWWIGGGVFLALMLFGFFGLPPIVKAQAIKQLSQRLGRAVTIEKVRVNPLVLSATIEGFSVAEADAAAGEFTGWKRLYVNYNAWSIFAGELGLEEVSLDGFRARVAKAKDGGLNFDDIVAKLTTPDPSAGPKDPNAKPPALAIGTLAVTDARVEFSDSSLQRPFSAVAGPLSFSLHDFRTVGDPHSPYRFEVVTAAGERVAWTGGVSADPVGSSGELVLQNIDLARLSPYYHRLVTGELRSAFLDVAGKYTFELKGAEPVLTLADGAFTLREVRFGAPGVEADAFALKRLAVSGVSADSAALKADVAKVSIEGVRVKATRDAQGIDLMNLLASPMEAGAGAVSPAAQTGATAGGPARMPMVKLGELSVWDVQAEVIDLTTPRRAQHRVEDVRLTLRDLDSADLAKLVPLALEVKLPQEGRIVVGGSVAAQPLAAELDVALEQVPFANASPYVEPFLNIRLAGGAVRTRGKATLRDGAVSFAGDFGLADFQSVDGKLAQNFMTWRDFSITGIRATSQPLAFHADEIRFVEPSALVRVEADGTLNIAQAAVDAEPKRGARPGAAPVSGPAVAVTVGKFAFERAAFRFEDHSVEPTARGGISDFTGTITGLSSEAPARADVDLRGKVDGVAPVAITGKLNPLGKPAFVDMKVDFLGIDLQPGAGPYVGKFAGRELARGNLNVAITAKLNDRKLDTSTVVTLDQFYLGQKTNSPEATKLPVGLALALLRDTEGRIVVDVPVKGSLDDPNFKVGRVVARVFVNILTKAATSPFSLLGASFGGGGDELGWQEFAAGEATLDEAGIKKLETVAKALNARPALRLDIVGAQDPSRDVAALRRERLEQRVRAEAWETRRLVDPNTPPPEQLEITPELRAGMLARLYATVFPPALGEMAPLVVAGEAEGAVTLPLVPLAGGTGSGADRAKRQVGRLPKFDGKPAPILPRQGSAAMAQRAARMPAGPAAEIGAVTAGAEVGEAAKGGIPTITLAEMEERLAGRIEIPATELQALGEARGQVIRAWLLETGKVAGERVFLAPVKAGGTRVSLNLN